MRRIFSVFTLTLFLFFLVSCGQSKTIGKSNSVMVSILPQKYFVEQIVGDKMTVECMLEKGGSPETYEPSFKAMTRLESSDLYFLIGNLGFESSLKTKMKDFNRDIKIIDTSLGLDLMKTEVDRNIVEDPHIWTSVRNVRGMIKNITDAVCAIDSTNGNFYRENYRKFDMELKEFDDSLSQILIHSKGTAFVVWHPALSYFSRDYGLEQIALEYGGKESPINYMEDKLNYAKSRNCKVFLSQFDMDASKTDVVSNQLNIKKVVVNPLEYEWKKELLKIAYAIAE